MSTIVEHHIKSAINTALEETHGLSIDARRHRAQSWLRLLTMNEDELWELCQLLSRPPARTPESILRELIAMIEERQKDAPEWLQYITPDPADYLPRN